MTMTGAQISSASFIDMKSTKNKVGLRRGSFILVSTCHSFAPSSLAEIKENSKKND